MRIGPSFASELRAAGLGSIPISWTEAGIQFGYDDLDDTTRAKLDAVLALHDPNAPDPSLQDEITPRQFYEEAAIEGIITKAEALAFMMSKTLPKILADPIGRLTEDQRFSVTMALMGSSYSRANPFTALVGQLIGKDAAAMDTFWRAAAAR